MHSGTKYLCGHNDILSGFLIVGQSPCSEQLIEEIGLYVKSQGANLSAQDSWLMLRSLKTLGLRVEKQAADENVKLFILCSPHNPVGRVWRRDELLRLAEICLANDVLIVADEIHHEFVRPGFSHTVLASLSEEIALHTVTCTAPSKTFNLAGLQVSNIFIKNTSMRRRFCQAVNAVGYSQPNTLGMFACQAAYTYGEPWLNQLRSYLEANYQRTREFLQRELPGVKLVEPEGTYLIWLDFRAYGLTDARLDDIIIHKANLWLDSGHIFGEGGSGFQRINIACPWATLEKGLKSLAAAFQAIS